MGSRNISISDEAYTRLTSKKKKGESFTDVINRLTGRRSLLELAGVLNEKEARDVELRVRELRRSSAKRLQTVVARTKAA